MINTKYSWLLFFSLLIVMTVNAQKETIRLITRADDMGMSHSSNLGCLEAYENGIVKSVEVMVPGPWFEEAVTLLNKNKDLDVGIHLTLTSEWDNYKWKPITECKSIIDNAGNFLPWVLKNNNAPGMSISESNWDINDFEKELRAQIELAIQKIPHVSHLTDHMGCLQFSEETKKLREILEKDYGLPILFPEIESVPKWSGDKSSGEMTRSLIAIIKQLESGTFLIIEHPAFNGADMRNLSFSSEIGMNRLSVKKTFTSKKLKRIIKKKNIELISYKDMIREK